jgi:hypothetical protein
MCCSLLGEDDILAHNPTAGLLRPAFAIVKDTTTRQVILCVRGTHSRQDMFTSLTGALQLCSKRMGSALAGQTYAVVPMLVNNRSSKNQGRC